MSSLSCNDRVGKNKGAKSGVLVEAKTPVHVPHSGTREKAITLRRLFISTFLILFFMVTFRAKVLSYQKYNIINNENIINYIAMMNDSSMYNVV